MSRRGTEILRELQHRESQRGPMPSWASEQTATIDDVVDWLDLLLRLRVDLRDIAEWLAKSPDADDILLWLRDRSTSPPAPAAPGAAAPPAPRSPR